MEVLINLMVVAISQCIYIIIPIITLHSSFFNVVFQLQFAFILFCIRCRCTAQGLGTHVLCKVFPLVFQVPTWHHAVSHMLIIFLMLHCTSPWLFCNCQFVLLIPCLSHAGPSAPPSWQPSVCSLRLWICTLEMYTILSVSFTSVELEKNPTHVGDEPSSVKVSMAAHLFHILLYSGNKVFEK